MQQGMRAGTLPSSTAHSPKTQRTQPGAAPSAYSSLEHTRWKAGQTLAMKAWGVIRSLERAWRVARPEMVAEGFLMKVLNIGEYQPHPGCNGLHINPFELIGVIVNVVLALDWATTVTAPAGGHIFRIWAYNTSVLSWLKNTSRDTNPIVRCLIHFLMAMLIASGIPCILQGEHLQYQARRMWEPIGCPAQP
jgi:hypothetical protein